MTTHPTIERSPKGEPERPAAGAPGPLDPDRTGTLLGVWAHPDDEAYLSAGLMARAHAGGHRVVVVTATDGERGTDDPAAWPPARLAARRRRELVASLRTLGVREHHRLGYPDGGCRDVDEAEAVAAIGRRLDEVQPDVVVTFGPDGMTGHDDHRAVSAWTTAAWRRHRPQARLLYATLLPSFHQAWGHLNERIGLFGDAAPPCTPPDEAALVLTSAGRRLDQKVRALLAHRSQTRPLATLVGLDTFRAWWAQEAFVHASHVLAGQA